jgi:hypothetical protein
MLLALVLSFDHRKSKDVAVASDMSPSSKQRKYVWYALTGYGVGLVTALAAGILSQSPQPALLYLVGVACVGFSDIAIILFLPPSYAFLTCVAPICKHQISELLASLSNFYMYICINDLLSDGTSDFRCPRRLGPSCTCHGWGMICGSCGKDPAQLWTTKLICWRSEMVQHLIKMTSVLWCNLTEEYVQENIYKIDRSW